MVAVGDATCRALRSCFEDGDRRTNIDARSLRETCPLQTAAEHRLTIDTDLLGVLVTTLVHMSQY